MSFNEPSVDFVYPDEKETPHDKPAHESEVLEVLLAWLFPPKAKPHAVLLRAYALAWYVRPGFLSKDAARTQQALADHLGVSKATLSRHVNDFRREFGFVVGGMRSEETRAKYAANAHRNADALAQSRTRGRPHPAPGKESP